MKITVRPTALIKPSWRVLGRGRERRIEVICENCGAVSLKRPSNLKFMHVYCSRACAAIRRRKNAGAFWDSFSKCDGCWIWGGSTNGKYGTVHQDGRHWYAHRYSWYIHNGPIPDGLMVLHHCDNPLCVNPDHLFLGDQFDNMQDAAQKGRTARGSRNGCSNLNEGDIQSIRAMHLSGASLAAIARLHGCSDSNIHRIIRGRTWRHAS